MPAPLNGKQFHFSPTVGEGELDTESTDAWTHVGTWRAARDRQEYSSAWHNSGGIHEVEVATGARIGPRVSDWDANRIEVQGYTDPGPRGHDAQAYDVWPYENTDEDPGSTSYLVRRSALRSKRFTPTRVER